jgi:SAM-dependent methyltransferase
VSEKFSYQEYVSDREFLDDYNAYQQKYAQRMRESDRVILNLVGGLLPELPVTSEAPRLLDIGCSTGNLLLHLKATYRERLDLVGGDLAKSSLDVCRANPALAGIDFQEMDIFNLPKGAFELIVVNAVFYMFDDEQYARALASVCKALTPGGSMITYDFAHDFAQDIEIIEKTSSHPNGLRLCFRPKAAVQAAMLAAGFSQVEFMPFELPIDLPRPADDREIVTYTVKVESDRRMAFRGTLYQPWCHMVASNG